MLYLIRALIYSACVLQNEILQKSGSPLAPRQEVLKDIHLYKERPEMMEINISLELLREVPGARLHQRVVNHNKRCLGMYYSKGITDTDNIHIYKTVVNCCNVVNYMNNRQKGGDSLYSKFLCSVVGKR